MGKPKYLLLSERMGNGETLEELADKARGIIDSKNILVTEHSCKKGEWVSCQGINMSSDEYSLLKEEPL